MKKTIVAFGALFWEQSAQTENLAGAPLELARNAAGLGDQCLIASRLGNDPPGQRAHESLLASHLDGKLLQWDDQHPTGAAQVESQHQRIARDYFVPPAAFDHIAPDTGLIKQTRRADCLFFDTLAMRSENNRTLLRRLWKEARSTFCDLNLHKDCFYLETVTDAIENADTLKMNLKEAHYVADLLEISHPSLPDFCRELIQRWELPLCLVTLGERGALAVSAEGEVHYLRGYQVDSADPAGAGEAFTAGFLHAWLERQPLAECCHQANATGALAAGRQGPSKQISVADLQAFLSRDHQRLSEPSLENLTTP